MQPPDPASSRDEVARPSGAGAAGSITGDLLRAELVRANHDVNNALNSVLVGSHLLQLSAADPDAVRRHADRIAQAARQGVAAASRAAALLRAAGVATPSHVSEPHP